MIQLTGIHFLKEFNIIKSCVFLLWVLSINKIFGSLFIAKPSVANSEKLCN